VILRELFASIGVKPEQSGFQKADGMIGSLKMALVGLGVTLTAGAVYKGLKGLVDSTYHAGYEARRAGERVGVAAGALQELKEAADDVGIHGGSVEQALRFVGRNASEAANGSGALQSAFKKLGVSVKDSSGHLRKADDLLMDLSDAFVAMPEAERPAAAMRLLGRTGGQMLPLLIKGKAGIAAMREEARATGLIMGEDALDAAQDYHKALDGLGDTTKGLKFSIGIPLLRVVAENMRALTGWIEKNRALIRDKVVEWVTRLISVLKAMMSLVHGAAEGISVFVRWLHEAAKGSEALRWAFVALGLGIAWALAPGTVAIVGLLGLLEEVWGWVTGKRKTLLEDLMGPFAEAKKKFSLSSMFDIKGNLISDKNPITAALKGWMTLLLHMEEVIHRIMRALFLEGGINDETAYALKLSAAVKASGHPMTDLRDTRRKDPRWHDLVQSGNFDAIRKEYGAGWSPYPGAKREPGRPFEELSSERQRELGEQWRKEAQDKRLSFWAAREFMAKQREEYGTVIPGAPTMPFAQGTPQLGPGSTFNFQFGDIVTPSPEAFTNYVEQHVRRVLVQEYGEAQTAGNR
jgi:TP901 family phage tail tape measure protein